MEIIVPIHRVEQPHAVNDETLLKTVNDPQGRVGLSGDDANTVHDYIKNAALRMGPGVHVIAADPGADTGQLFIVRVEIECTSLLIEDAVSQIERLALEAFGRI